MEPVSGFAVMDGMNHAAGKHLILYDGVCGYCNRWVRFILKRDRGSLFYFSPLQSDTARRLLTEFGKDPDLLETFYIVKNYRTKDEALISKREASIFIVDTLGYPWKLLAILRLIPEGLYNIGYDWIARHRYKFFGKYDTCPVPEEKYKARFLDS